MARNRARGGRNRSNKIMATRIVPDGEGDRELRMERQLAAIKESQSTTRIQVKDSFFVTVGTTAAIGAYSYGNIRGTDEFVALAGQFRKYRVVGMRFTVYDFVPSSGVTALFGTQHQTQQITQQQQVVDLPDSGTVPPGVGKYSWYWYPSGPLEHSWFAVDDTTTDFGGLAWYTYGAPSSTSKYNVIVSAIVDFRARD